jgi:hypothetical protein
MLIPTALGKAYRLYPQVNTLYAAVFGVFEILARHILSALHRLKVVAVLTQGN